MERTGIARRDQGAVLCVEEYTWKFNNGLS